MPAKTKAPRALLLSTREVPLTLRRVRGARRMTLHWRPCKRDVLLTLPHGVAFQKALRFAESRKHWLEEQVEMHGKRIAFADGEVIPLLGRHYTIRHDPNRRGVVAIEGDSLLVFGKAEFVSRRLRDWLMERANAEISTRAHARAGLLGKHIRRIRLRDTGSRWGSCGANGVLTFSWRLIFASPDVLNYVVSHEVAHLKELNHSPRFWRIVAELCPHYMESRNWLTRHGHTLYAYG